MTSRESRSTFATALSQQLSHVTTSKDPVRLLEGVSLRHPASLFERLGIAELGEYVSLGRWTGVQNKWEARHLQDKLLGKVAERLERKRLAKHQQSKEVAVLGTGWTRLIPYKTQTALWKSNRRFTIVPAGRRSGKTAYAKRFIVKKALQAVVRAALGDENFLDAWFVCAAPTHAQAKRIYWNDLQKLVPKSEIVSISHSELTITLKFGVQIQVVGMDRPERVEGRPLNGIVLDEYGNMKAGAWTENIRPALADRQGWAWLIGVPEGRNHYYDLYIKAQANEDGEWAAFTWSTEDVLPLYLGKEKAAKEIESAKHDMDPLTYDQEYRASFVTFTGVAYYQFGDWNKAKVKYDPQADLILCFDFNIAPGVAVALHERNSRTEIVGEVHIKNNSNTPRVCDKIIANWGKHKGNVFLYGDATAGAGGTAKVAGNDWDLIRAKLKPVFGDRLFFRVPLGNMGERVRVNAVNSRLKSAAGDVKLVVDYSCVWTIKDFEGVVVLEGGSGEIDKDATPELTHITDAVGYYVAKKHPIGGAAVSTTAG